MDAIQSAHGGRLPVADHKRPVRDLSTTSRRMVGVLTWLRVSDQGANLTMVAVRPPTGLILDGRR